MTWLIGRETVSWNEDGSRGIFKNLRREWEESKQVLAFQMQLHEAEARPPACTLHLFYWNTACPCLCPFWAAAPCRFSAANYRRVPSTARSMSLDLASWRDGKAFFQPDGRHEVHGALKPLVAVPSFKT